MTTPTNQELKDEIDRLTGRMARLAIKLPAYEGKPGESIDQWLDRSLSRLSVNSIQNEKEIGRALFLAIQGSAFNWFLEKRNTMTFDANGNLEKLPDIIDAAGAAANPPTAMFKSLKEMVEFIRSKSGRTVPQDLEALNKMFNISMKGGTIETYNYTFRQLRTKISSTVDEATIKHCYVKGLDSWVVSSILVHTLDAYTKYTYAQWMEATDQLAVMKKTRQQINFGSYTPKYTYNGQQRYERASKQERDPNAMDIDAIRGLPKKGSIKCYNCGRIGHMSRNCTAPRKSFQKRGTPKNKGSLGKSSRKPPRKPKKHLHARTQEIESEDSDDDKVIDYRIRCPIPRCRKPLQYDHVAYARGQTDCYTCKHTKEERKEYKAKKAAEERNSSQGKA